jgi:hypothetical protein
MHPIEMVKDGDGQMLKFTRTSELWKTVVSWSEKLVSYCQGPISEEIFREFSIETKFKTIATTTKRSPMYGMYNRALALGKPFPDNTSVIYCIANGDKYSMDMLEVEPHRLDLEYYLTCMQKLLIQITYFRPPKEGSGLRVDVGDFFNT